MSYKKVLGVVVVIATVIFIGCDSINQARLIPKEDVSVEMEKSIAQAIENKDHSQLRSYGQKALPMLVKTVLAEADSFDAGNFILDIGKIGDKRAVPALLHILSNVKYRISHKAVSMALADIQDRLAVDELKRAFEREKGYIAAGNNKGPDYGWGLANDYALQVARQHGLTLQRLGASVGDIPQDNLSKMQEEFNRLKNMR